MKAIHQRAFFGCSDAKCSQCNVCFPTVSCHGLQYCDPSLLYCPLGSVCIWFLRSEEVNLLTRVECKKDQKKLAKVLK